MPAPKEPVLLAEPMHRPVSRRIALRTGLSYHALEWSTAATPCQHTVILLHGFLDFAWTWEAVVHSGLLAAAAADGYRLIAPDLRGHGDSDRVGIGGYYHFMDYTADVLDLIEQLRQPEQLGTHRVSLVGHSMGGTVAAYCAGAYPERIFRLALLEGLGPKEQSFDTMPERIRTWSTAWWRALKQELRPMANLQEAADRLKRHDPLLSADAALTLAEHGTCVLADGRRLFKHDPLHLTPGPYPFSLAVAQAFWRRITCPVLLIQGEHSELGLTQEELAHRQSLFGAAKANDTGQVKVPVQIRTAMLPGAGHMMQRHAPVALAQLLADFLR